MKSSPYGSGSWSEATTGHSPLTLDGGGLLAGGAGGGLLAGGAGGGLLARGEETESAHP